MAEARVTLYSGHKQYDIPPSSETNIPSGYNEVEVRRGTWVFYDQPIFEQSKTGGKIVREGEGRVSIGFDARSCRELHIRADGIVLFEHYHYFGKMKTITESEPEITGFRSGVSSVIILPSSEWILYTQQHYKGEHVTLPPGDYPSPGSMELPNDSVHSVRRA